MGNEGFEPPTLRVETECASAAPIPQDSTGAFLRRQGLFSVDELDDDGIELTTRPVDLGTILPDLLESLHDGLTAAGMVGIDHVGIPVEAQSELLGTETLELGRPGALRGRGDARNLPRDGHPTIRIVVEERGEERAHASVTTMGAKDFQTGS